MKGNLYIMYHHGCSTGWINNFIFINFILSNHEQITKYAFHLFIEITHYQMEPFYRALHLCMLNNLIISAREDPGPDVLIT